MSYRKFKPGDKHYNPMYDGLPRYTSPFTRIAFFIESIVISLVFFVILIVPFVMHITNFTLNKGAVEGFGQAFSSVPLQAFLVSCLSLLFTIPYGLVRKNKYGNKAFFSAVGTLILLTTALSFFGMFLSALGLLGA